MYEHVHRAHHFFKQFGKLHVIAVCFNPLRYISRQTLFREFVQRAVQQGAVVHVAEVTMRNRPHEVQQDGQEQHWCYRITDEVWHKEAIINSAVSKLPSDWEYVAWVDGDVAFANPHWVQETIQQLQHYAIVQMFHTAADLDAENNITRSFKGYPASYVENPAEPDHRHASDYYVTGVPSGPTAGYWHPGYAWACRRDAWQAMGGLLDINVVGGADHQMAAGLYGRASKAIPFKSTTSYRKAVLGWQSHALLLKQDVGFVPGTLLHYWHGQKTKRGYFDRWQILAENNFDPVTDLRRDWQGLWQLAGNKPRMRDQLRAYFRQRQEDSLD